MKQKVTDEQLIEALGKATKALFGKEQGFPIDGPKFNWFLGATVIRKQLKINISNPAFHKRMKKLASEGKILTQALYPTNRGYSLLEKY